MSLEPYHILKIALRLIHTQNWGKGIGLAQAEAAGGEVDRGKSDLMQNECTDPGLR